MNEERRIRIAHRLGVAGIDLPEEMHGRFDALIDILNKYNAVVSLSAITDEDEIIEKHLVDSLIALPFLPESGRVVDIGSGNGFPGLPLAVARPGLAMTLLESVRRKATYLANAAWELRLPQVTAVEERLERFAPMHGGVFAVAMMRAFGRIDEYWDLINELLAPGGVLLAWKSALTPGEEQLLRKKKVRRLNYSVGGETRTVFLI